MAVGMKLELSSRGHPCNLNVGELFQEALYTVPVQQWSSWLSDRVNEHRVPTDSRSNVDKINQALSPTSRTKKRVNTNTIEM